MLHWPLEELLDRDPIAADEQLPRSWERGPERGEARERIPCPPTLHFDRRDRLAGADDEVDFVAALAPIEPSQMPAAAALARCPPTEDSTTRPQNAGSRRASASDTPDCAVISAVLSTWSFGLEPR
jgi:hypothetical protein